MKIFLYMRLFVEILLYSSVMCSAIPFSDLPSRSISPRIVGGKVSDINKFPYVALLRVFYADNSNQYGNDYSDCTGVIIGAEWILTAAHCFNHPVIKRAYIHAGNTNKDGGEGSYSFLKPAIKHPNYNAINGDNDFALVKLNDKLIWSDKIDYIDLPNDDDKVKAGDLCFAVGWVLSVCSSVIKFNEYLTDAGNDISIPCLARGATVMWVKEECNETIEFLRGPDLRIYNIQPSDAGTYICLVSPDESDLTDVVDEDTSSSWSSSSQEKPTSDNSFLEELTIVLKVRSVPGPVTKLSVRLSTILGVLMWEYSSNYSGGYPLKSFTAEFRRYCAAADIDESVNASLLLWHRLDPQNIPSNVRYYEVYHLIPNTTYEFRLWANNYLGAGEAVTISATTLGQLSDENVLDIILKDVKDFDPQIWVYAVGISLSALVVLGLTMCILLLRDHYLDMEEKRRREEDEWGSIGIIPNIILNPGFLEPEDPNDPSPPYTRTIIFGEDVLSTSESGSSEEDSPISFKRKFSLFFTGDTIKRL